MKVLILTGAGISAESGIPTFRGANGLWEGHRIEEVATPEAFDHDPQLVHRFYNQRRRNLLSAEIQPNAAHRALAEFESQHQDEFLLVTQNIDDLHRRAGSQKVLSMHGELLKARCLETGELFDWREDIDSKTPHPSTCVHREDRNGNSAGHMRLGGLRPHVVWFGEIPLGLEQIRAAAAVADLFVAIGTSAVVYPAAGIVQQTRPSCHRVEINLEETPQSSQFAETLRGRASDLVPEFLARGWH